VVLGIVFSEQLVISFLPKSAKNKPLRLRERTCSFLWKHAADFRGFFSAERAPVYQELDPPIPDGSKKKSKQASKPNSEDLGQIDKKSNTNVDDPESDSDLSEILSSDSFDEDLDESFFESENDEYHEYISKLLDPLEYADTIEIMAQNPLHLRHQLS